MLTNAMTFFNSFLISLTAFSATAATVAKVETLKTKTGAVKVEHLEKLNEPWGMAFLPDGRLLITEKAGSLKIYSDGKLSKSIKGLPEVSYRGQGGLLDIEVDPNFTINNFIYISFVEAATEQPKGAKLKVDPRLGTFIEKDDVVIKGAVVARAKLQNEELKDLTVIWRQVPKTMGLGHYGGRMTFAKDGKLFITSGDRQLFDPAQDMKSNLGKVLRINSDGTIPKDNPYAKKGGVEAQIWTSGHRNSLGLAINPSTQKLWAIEMGPVHGDEINLIEAGKNYGWPIVSNGNNYDGTVIPDHETKPKFAGPLYYWHPAISPSGMAFYNGTKFQNWQGSLLVGALSGETLLRLTLEGDKVTSEERLPINKRIRDVAAAKDGSVLLLTDGKDGELLRLNPEVTSLN